MTDFAVGHMAMLRFHVDIFQFRPLKKKQIIKFQVQFQQVFHGVSKSFRTGVRSVLCVGLPW